MPSDLLGYRVEGEGEPLLLLNGIAMTVASWDPVVARLPGRRTIRCDLRGQLLSPGPPPSNLAGHARDVAELLDRLGTGPADVLATSFGAAVAVTLAAARPDLVRSLTLVAAVDRATPGMREEIRRWRLACRAVLEGSDPAALFDVMAPTVFSPGWVAGEAGRARREALAALPREWFQGLEALLATAGAMDVSAAAAAVRCPALVAAAGEDRFMPLPRVEALAAAIPDAAFTVLEGLPHAAVVEAPDRVAALVSRPPGA